MTERIIAYSLLALFFIMDFVIRKGRTAKTVEQTKDDKNSTQILIAVFTIVLVASYILNYYHICSFNNTTVAVTALLAMLAGFFIRIWAMQVLTRFYTRSLLTVEKQKLVRSGPYSKVRHPGYLGTIIIWTMSGLAMQNWCIFILSAVLIFAAYYYRIYTEEEMLAQTFGKDYEVYKRQSWRLIPFIW